MSKLHDLKTIPDCFGKSYDPHSYSCLVSCKMRKSCEEKCTPAEPKLEDSNRSEFEAFKRRWNR